MFGERQIFSFHVNQVYTEILLPVYTYILLNIPLGRSHLLLICCLFHLDHLLEVFNHRIHLSFIFWCLTDCNTCRNLSQLKYKQIEAEFRALLSI